MTMEDFNQLLANITDPKHSSYAVPAAVCSVVNRDGKSMSLWKVVYSRSAGTSGTDVPLSENSVFWMASQTKVMTTIAAMQCVERNLIGFDEDVARVLPDLSLLEILDGRDSFGRWKTRKRTKKITLSGVSVEGMSTSLAEWAKQNNFSNHSLDNTMISTRVLPLVDEPGAQLLYGAGIDWAGILVERLSGQTLEDYMSQNIWKPLGMTSTTFHPELNPDIHARLVKPYERTAEGTLKPRETPLVPIPSPTSVGGHGAYSCPKDYVKLFTALLQGGQPILKKHTLDEIFSPQLVHKESIKTFLEGPFAFMLGYSIPKGVHTDHGLAGLLAMEDHPGGRRKGSLQWIGMPNNFWWVDPQTGIAGVVFCQYFPPGDPGAVSIHKGLESAVYGTFK
ncbi:hypothetical protein AYO21_06697 [Fonsecaea monophora]|uniref:Beta-lactamase-related domain-containing protein n=1 Tax=Fonsecaea monophora TaxID=254056 RepID=A0A177F5M3_9EURO|nr:hypothetical protein AYO21_06697 [Fonsecaea monophora]OAG39146.1 hypothetical protein AYO21_06697 [Fonsecaea monophora]